MQYEISRLHRALGFTVLYVTHDQTEALTMSDRIAVFNAGVVQQCAAPATLYERPANAFVADFIGENNLIPGTISTADGNTVKVRVGGSATLTAQHGDTTDRGGACIVSVRPEKISIGDRGGSGARDGAPDNRIRATFMVKHYVGDFARYYYELPGGTEVTVKMLNDLSAPNPERGETSLLTWQAADCFAFQPP